MKRARLSEDGTGIIIPALDCDDDPMVLEVDVSDDGKSLEFNGDGFTCTVTLKNIQAIAPLVVKVILGRLDLHMRRK